MTHPHLIRLIASNLPGGLSVDVNTDGPTLLLGHNTSGKTRTLAAIDAGLAGPKVGVWGGLGRPTEDMEITLSFDCATIRRQRTANGNPTFVGGPNEIGRTVSPAVAASAVAQALGVPVGSVDHLASGRLDLDALLGVSAPQRSQWFAKHITGRSYTLDRVRSILTEEGVRLDLVEDAARDTAWQRGREPLPSLRTSDGEGYLSAVTAVTREYATHLQSVVQTHIKAVTSDEQLAESSRAALPPGTVDGYQRTIDALEAEKAPLQAAIDAAGRSATRRATLDAKLTSDAETLTRSRAECERLAGELTNLRESIPGLEVAKAEAEVALGVARAAERAAADAVGTTGQRVTELAERRTRRAADRDARAAEIRALEAQITRITAAPEGRELLRARIDTVLAYVDGLGATVPTDTYEACALIRVDLDTYLPGRGNAGTGLADVEAQLATARELLDVAEADVEVLDSGLSRARAAKQEMEDAFRQTQQASAHHARAMQSAQTALHTARTRATTLESNYKTLVSTVSALETGLEAARLEREGLSENDERSARERVRAITTELIEARSAMQRLAADAAHREASVRRAEAAQAAADERDLFKGFSAGIARARARLAAEAVDPIADTACMVYSAVLDGKLVVRDGEVSIERGGSTYPLSQASGAETAIVGAALTAALSAQLPGWRAVIIDECNTIEPEFRVKLARVLAAMQAEGRIDNVILAGWPDDGMREIASTGYHVHNLSPAAE